MSLPRYSQPLRARASAPRPAPGPAPARAKPSILPISVRIAMELIQNVSDNNNCVTLSIRADKASSGADWNNLIPQIRMAVMLQLSEADWRCEDRDLHDEDINISKRTCGHDNDDLCYDIRISGTAKWADAMRDRIMQKGGGLSLPRLNRARMAVARPYEGPDPANQWPLVFIQEASDSQCLTASTMYNMLVELHLQVKWVVQLDSGELTDRAHVTQFAGPPGMTSPPALETWLNAPGRRGMLVLMGSSKETHDFINKLKPGFQLQCEASFEQRARVPRVSISGQRLTIKLAPQAPTTPLGQPPKSRPGKPWAGTADAGVVQPDPTPTSADLAEATAAVASVLAPARANAAAVPPAVTKPLTAAPEGATPKGLASAAAAAATPTAVSKQQQQKEQQLLKDRQQLQKDRLQLRKEWQQLRKERQQLQQQQVQQQQQQQQQAQQQQQHPPSMTEQQAPFRAYVNLREPQTVPHRKYVHAPRSTNSVTATPSKDRACTPAYRGRFQLLGEGGIDQLLEAAQSSAGKPAAARPLTVLQARDEQPPPDHTAATAAAAPVQGMDIEVAAEEPGGVPAMPDGGHGGRVDSHDQPTLTDQPTAELLQQTMEIDALAAEGPVGPPPNT